MRELIYKNRVLFFFMKKVETQDKMNYLGPNYQMKKKTENSDVIYKLQTTKKIQKFLKKFYIVSYKQFILYRKTFK